MNSDTARGLVVYLPLFKGDESIVISCNDAGLHSLIRDFNGLLPRNSSGTAELPIGKRPPILSDGDCIVTVKVRNRQPMRVARQKAELFMWKMDWDGLAGVVQKLRAMSEYGRPCHQYFESAENSVSSPIILVSLLEYEDDWLLRMKEDDQPQIVSSDDIEFHQPDR
jgi:hypothetical protein